MKALRKSNDDQKPSSILSLVNTLIPQGINAEDLIRSALSKSATSGCETKPECPKPVDPVPAQPKTQEGEASTCPIRPSVKSCVAIKKKPYGEGETPKQPVVIFTPSGGGGFASTVDPTIKEPTPGSEL